MVIDAIKDYNKNRSYKEVVVYLKDYICSENWDGNRERTFYYNISLVICSQWCYWG